MELTIVPSTVIGGSGTLNHIVKWTPDGNTLGDSDLIDNGSAIYTLGRTVGIGNATPGYELEVNGNISSNKLGNGFRVKEGANAKMGAAVLVAGTLVVNTTAVTANSRIFLTSNVDGGTPGSAVRVSARVAGTSFTITSINSLDTSTIAWIIFEPS